jgi:hypothetical protein
MTGRPLSYRQIDALRGWDVRVFRFVRNAHSLQGDLSQRGFAVAAALPGMSAITNYHMDEILAMIT